MTPDTEREFIALWQEGLSHDAMAQHLGIPVGTVKSRAYTLQQRGRIQPRLRGKASQGLQRQGGTPEVSPDTLGGSKRVSTRTRKKSSGVSAQVSPDHPIGAVPAPEPGGDAPPPPQYFAGAAPPHRGTRRQGVNRHPSGVSKGVRRGVTSHPPAGGAWSIDALEPPPVRPAARAHQGYGSRAGPAGSSDGRGIVVAGIGDGGGDRACLSGDCRRWHRRDDKPGRGGSSADCSSGWP
jgi:hypothetical protein